MPRTTVLPLRMFALIEEALDVRVAAMSGILIAVTLVGARCRPQLLAPSRPITSAAAGRRSIEGTSL